MSLTFCEGCGKQISTHKKMRARFKGKDYCHKCYVEVMEKAREKEA